MVTRLESAEKWDQSHLSSPEIAPLVDAAKVFYVEGYFLTHGTDSVVELGKKASHASKVPSFCSSTADSLLTRFHQVFALNLSAPFIAQFFGAQLQKVVPYCDIIICNESEAEAWASAIGLPDKTDLKATAKALALAPKSNPSRPRVVIFTQGADSTILVSAADPENPKVYPVEALASSSILDTTGAGDAFAGGFLGAFVSGKTLDESVEAGHKLGRMCIQQVRVLILQLLTLG